MKNKNLTWLTVTGMVAIMLALPVAMKLASTNQDNRNLAASCDDSGCQNVKNGNYWMITNCAAAGDADGDQQLCSLAGRIGQCGGNNMCCPAAGEKWTTDMTKCNSSTTGGESKVNFKISFANVWSGTANCTSDWTVQVLAKKGGAEKGVTGVTLTKTGEKDGRAVYSGTADLVGVGPGSGAAIFIKGPKHLQMKFGISGQTGPYNKAGGEVTLTSGSEINDFSGYPILPGDVTSEATAGVQDGWINGLDFSYVKTRADHRGVSDKNDWLADLDGNCQVNSNDVNVLKISLEKKQEQTY